MTLALAALTAAQILIGAPVDAVGTTPRDARARLGEPKSTGTDFVDSPGGGTVRDRVVTLDFAATRVRIYEVPEKSQSYLLSVATIDAKFPTRTGVHVGVDRGTVLRELGGPAYEDGDQLIYVEPADGDPSTGDRVRLVLEDDRVVGIEWIYAVR